MRQLALLLAYLLLFWLLHRQLLSFL